MTVLKSLLHQKLRELQYILILPAALLGIGLTAVALTYGMFELFELSHTHPKVLIGILALCGLLIAITFLPIALVALALFGARFGLASLGVEDILPYCLAAWLTGSLLKLGEHRFAAGLTRKVQHPLLTFWGRQVVWLGGFLCWWSLVVAGVWLLYNCLGMDHPVPWLIVAWLLGNVLQCAVLRRSSEQAPGTQHRLLALWGDQARWVARYFSYVPPVMLLGLLVRYVAGSVGI